MLPCPHCTRFAEQTPFTLHRIDRILTLAWLGRTWVHDAQPRQAIEQGRPLSMAKVQPLFMGQVPSPLETRALALAVVVALALASTLAGILVMRHPCPHPCPHLELCGNPQH